VHADEIWRAVGEAAPCGIVMVDAQGKIVLANPHAEKLLGYAAADLVGHSVESLVPEPLRTAHPAHRDGFHRDTQARPMGAGRDLFALRKDGIEIPVELGLSPFATEAGTLVAVFIIDITERKKHEAAQQTLSEKLEQRSAQLEAANKELEAFCYSVSHDLRAPLRAIDGFSRILLDDHADRLDAEGKRLLDVVRERTVAMGKLIDDLLEFSRVGRGRFDLSVVDMTALARGALTEVLAANPSRRVETTVSLLPAATGNLAFLRQMWTNLLSNAVKYTRSREIAHVEIGGREDETEHVYYVKDDGVGFDMRYSHKLFGVFQRLHSDDEFSGTGVGLALVRRIVERHGGRVWAEAKVGEGAIFYFALPTGG
jgi:PAS domain S-box-containing protein